jgi:hypothetical protein
MLDPRARTRRGSGESHLVNGERIEVFVLRIVRGRSRKTRRGSGEQSHPFLRSSLWKGRGRWCFRIVSKEQENRERIR